MKITIKTYQQPEADFQVDAEASETVANLKTKISGSQGYDIGKQNLIFCGKVLANDETLESYKISEKGYLVLLISRPRPPLPEPKPVELSEFDHFSEQSSSSSSLLVPEIISAPVSTSTVPVSTSASTFKYVPLTPSVQVPKTTSAPVVASESGSASKSTFKYVPMSTYAHVPASASASTSTSVLATTPQQQQGSALGGLTSAGSSGSDGPTAAHDPQIALFRELIERYPQFRQHFIQQVTEKEPELGQMLVQNPDLLLQFLDRIGEGPSVLPAQGVTEAERAALQRLEALGFSRQAAIEAYFACDKSEELAANYLLENA